MDCCLYYILHINLHIFLYLFHQDESKFERILSIQQLHQKLSRKQD